MSHFARGSSLMHALASVPAIKSEQEPHLIKSQSGAGKESDAKIKKEEKDEDKPLPKCTKGYGSSYGRFAPQCVTWQCECPLRGSCTPPGNGEFCTKPCKKHFPDQPYKCKGGRSREMPNGCIIWQCNCAWSLMGRCVMPEGICKDPCTVHPKNPLCRKCKVELTDLQCKEFFWGKKCDKCSKKDLFDADRQ